MANNNEEKLAPGADIIRAFSQQELADKLVKQWLDILGEDLTKENTETTDEEAN